jgi:hypothetical protein
VASPGHGSDRDDQVDRVIGGQQEIDFAHIGIEIDRLAIVLASIGILGGSGSELGLHLNRVGEPV